MARKPLVAGNWKMNNTVGQALDLVSGVATKTRNVHKVEIVVAPVFTAIKTVADFLIETGSPVQVAAQNVFWEESGAYTGEVSPVMLKEAGCKWVIVGHSERRQYFGETDETVNKRVRAALNLGGLKPIVCVGETLAERESSATEAVLTRQIKGALGGLTTADMEKVVIAYEPVWAIGTGKTATPDMADAAHAHIRSELENLFGGDTAEKTRILYGGSMKPENAAELLAMEHIDGGLIGGASLKVADFVAIIDAALAD
jgi:triosephosphate isomerase